MKTSCGILLKHGDKYLIGHTNGGSVPNAWTIFKEDGFQGFVEKGQVFEL